MTAQPLALVGAGGYPDGVWTCAWCAAELADGKIRHREDCAWLAEIRTDERERIAKLAEQYQARYWAHNNAQGTYHPFADLIREEAAT